MAAVRSLISFLLLWVLLGPFAFAQTVADSASTFAGAGGETSGIVYHRYTDPVDISAAASVSVWRFTIRDGGSFFGDDDPYPTIVDSLRIGVRLVGALPGARATRSIAWAGIYSTDSIPRLLATARITADSLLFDAISTVGVRAPDNGAALFQIRLKLADTATPGDRLQFSVAERDIVTRRAGSSRFARFGVVRSSTGGDLNRIITTGLHLVVSSPFPDTAQPGVRFGGALSIVDSLGTLMTGSTDTLRLYSRTGFGTVTGGLAAVDSAGIFRFDSLYYPFRNDSAIVGFFHPGVDTLEIGLLFSGGAPTVPTVAHLRPSVRGLRRIDGTGISLESESIDGIFLFERIERTPATIGALPDGVSQLLSRYFRITPLPGSAIGGSFRLGLPIDRLATGGHPSSIRLLYRPDSLTAWSDPTTVVDGFDEFTLYGKFDSTGEFALGTNVDVAVPLTGLSFSGELVDGVSPRLNWRTASEIGNAGFILRRSSGANGPFVTVDSYRANDALKGSGTSAIGAAYHWVDHDPRLSGWSEVWYLLVEVSFDGIESVHGPVHLGLDDAPGNAGDRNPGVAARPNPFHSGTTLGFTTSNAGDVVLSLYDSRGAVVVTKRFTVATAGRHEIYLPAEDLPPGAYRYRIEFDGGESTGGIVRRER
jgi:hypothetical protein